MHHSPGPQCWIITWVWWDPSRLSGVYGRRDHAPGQGNASPGAAVSMISTSSAQGSSAQYGPALHHYFMRSEMLQTSTTNYEWAIKKAKLTQFPVSLPQQEQQDHITYKRSLETQITLQFSALPNFIISVSSKPTRQELKYSDSTHCRLLI